MAKEGLFPTESLFSCGWPSRWLLLWRAFSLAVGSELANRGVCLHRPQLSRNPA